MKRPQVLVLADDMTGALEAGAAFAGAGIDSSVSTLPELAPAVTATGTAVLVIDTETRHVPAQEAYRRISNLARAARAEGIRFLLKKTDSTLRGNIAAELAAAVDAWQGVPLIYLPAYPKLDRTVRGGALHVGGRPVSRTEFGSDPREPVRESHIPTLLRSAGFPLRLVTLWPEEIERTTEASAYIVDGETEEQMERCVRALAARPGSFVLAGPAGLAHHLARAVSLSRSEPRPWPAGRRGLVINGSLHPTSANQIVRAQSCGIPAVEVEAMPAAIDRFGWAILRNPASGTTDSGDFARRLGVHVAQAMKRADLDALLVFGGDTAFGIVEALGSPVLHCLGEVLPGVPAALVTILPRCKRELLLVSKAGGFGAVDVVTHIRERIAPG